jgi:hypothetical protein
MQPLVQQEPAEEQKEEVKQPPRQSFTRRVIEAIRRFPDAPRRVIMSEVQLLRLATRPNRRATIEEVRSALSLGII